MSATSYVPGSRQSTADLPSKASQQVHAEQDAGAAVKGADEEDLLSCLVVVPIGVQDPALGGWCNMD